MFQWYDRDDKEKVMRALEHGNYRTRNIEAFRVGQLVYWRKS